MKKSSRNIVWTGGLAILLLLVWLGLYAFRSDQLTKTEYIAWVNNPDNGLNVKKQIGEYSFSVLYKPADYIIAMENKDIPLSTEQWQKEKDRLKDMQYYTLKIEADNGEEVLKKGIESDAEYYERLEYFMSMMQEDISLIEKQDTLPCILYHFERNYGAAPFTQMVLAFEKSEEEKQSTRKCEDKTIRINDRILGIGSLSMRVSGSDIQQLPKLKIN